MFKYILVPVKATRGSEKAIQVACELAGQLDAEVHVITVNVEGVEDKLSEKMRDAFINICRGKGIEATYSKYTVKTEKEVAKEIASISRDYNLMVMGHCRYKKIYKFLHESVAEDLIKLASCPVVVAAADCPDKHHMD